LLSTHSRNGNFQSMCPTPRCTKGGANYADVEFQAKRAERQVNQQALSSVLWSLVKLLCANFWQPDYGKARFDCSSESGQRAITRGPVSPSEYTGSHYLRMPRHWKTLGMLMKLPCCWENS
jgi:hypothetical protein